MGDFARRELGRQGILLEGPDAANFHVFAADGIHDPVGRTTVASGHSEAFVVEYCPRESRRSHQARVHVYAANGTMSGQPVEGILPLTANAPPSVAPCLLRTPPPRPTGSPQ